VGNRTEHRPSMVSTVAVGAIRTRTFVLCAALVAMIMCLLISAGAAKADYTWTGDFYCWTMSGCNNSTLWSEGNWTTAPPSVNDPALGVLDFPGEPNCPGPQDCYGSDDNLDTGFTASQIKLDDAVPYLISALPPTGEAMTPIGLGSGGIVAAYQPQSNSEIDGANWSIPLALTADQNWSVQGAGGTFGGTVFFGAPVTGSASLGATLDDDAELGLDTAEVGPFTATGADSSDTGLQASDNGVVQATELNSADGEPVDVNDIALEAVAPESTFGPITAQGAVILIAQDEGAPPIMSVAGGVSLDGSTVTSMQIDGTGTTAGTDFSQLTATGDVSLGGRLFVSAGGSQFDDGCPSGSSTVPLIQTTGTLSGTFANASNGEIIPLQDCPQDAQLGLQINYTAHAVTATVVPSTTTTTQLSADPADPDAGASVTLTADISTAQAFDDGPSGTVAFLNGTTPISGCSAQPVTATNETTGTATCTTSFAASSTPLSLTASYLPPAGDGLTGSVSAPLSLTVGSGTGTGGGSGTGATGSAGSNGTTATPGGTPTTGASPPTTAPRPAALTARAGAPKISGTTATVPVTCTGTSACSVTAVLTTNGVATPHAVAPDTKHRSRTITLGRTTTKLASGQTANVKVSLDKAGRTLLSEHRRLTVTLRVTLGSTAITTRTVRFTRVKRR
jgi:hypothetical protein